MTPPVPGSSSWYESLPAKRCAAAVLFSQPDGRVLLVKPTYLPSPGKDVWLLPGGHVEPDESPFEAAMREVEEELNLVKTPLDLACVDWQPPVHPLNEALMFIFHGGALTDEDLSNIKLPARELSDWALVAADDVDNYLLPYTARRVKACLAHPLRTLYLDKGHPPT